MSARQTTLTFRQTDASWQGFFWSQTNGLIKQVIDKWRMGDGQHALYLYGEPAAGKTQLLRHLLLDDVATFAIDGKQIVAVDYATMPSGTRRVLIDDIDAICGNQQAEERCFHQLNHWQSCGVQLLFTARKLVTTYSWCLADVRTRLEQYLALNLEPLDDASLIKALSAFAQYNGWHKCEQQIAYLCEKLPGRINALFSLVDAIIADFPINAKPSRQALLHYLGEYQ